MAPLMLALAALLLSGGRDPSAAAASRHVQIEPTDRRVSVAPAVEWLEDPGGQMTLADVVGGANSGRFRRWGGRGDVHFGLSRSTYWLRVSVRRAPGAPSEWVLVTTGRPSFQLDVYDATGQRLELSTSADGQSVLRPALIPLAVGPTPLTLYLRVRSGHTVTVPLTLWRPKAYGQYAEALLTLEAMYYGGSLALVLFYVLLFVTLRDERYLAYVLFALAASLATFLHNGMGTALSWPIAPAWEIVASVTLYALAGAAEVHFARMCLRLSSVSATLDRALQRLIIGFLALSTLAWPVRFGWLHPRLVGGLFVSLISIAGVLVPLAAVRARRAAVHGSNYFVIAFTLAWLGTSLSSLRVLGGVPSTPWTAFAMQIGFGLEVLVLAIALTDIVRVERVQREAALTDAIESQRQLVVLLTASEERLGRAVEERTAELKVAVEEKSATLQQYLRFGALISHEFRNPLGVILSQVALLRRTHHSLSEELTQRLGIVHGATRRLAALFDAWLEGDGVARASTRFLPQPIPLRSWLEERVEEHQHLAVQHQVHTSVSLDLHTIVADPHLLDLAFSNLLVNALKYAPGGTVVRVSARRERDEIVIVVADEGPGIAPALRARIFDAYARGTHESSVPGLGLGLSTVREAMDAHGGRVTLECGPDRGNSFCLWLPAAECPPNAAPVAGACS